MIIYINNITCKVSLSGSDVLSGIDIHKKLYVALKERVKGYSYAPSYRNRTWDGYHRFYSKITNKFPTGMLPLVLQYVEKWGVKKIVVKDERKNLPIFKEDFVKELSDNLNLRDYQEGLVRSINRSITFQNQKIYFPRGVYDAAVNAGKTYSILGLYRNIENPKILFLVSEQVLFVQTMEFFKQYFDVGMIKSTFKHPDKTYRKASHIVTNFTVAMTATLKNRLYGKDKLNYRSQLKDINVLVTDECHNAVNNTHKKVAIQIDAGCRVYMSGSSTGFGSPLDRVMLIGMAGPVVAKISNKFLVRSGYSKSVNVNMYLNDINSNKVGLMSYNEEMDECLVFSEARIKTIKSIVKSNPDAYILITVWYKRHGQFIYDRLREDKDYNIPTEWVHGTDPDKAYKINKFLDKQINVLITSQIVRQGVNMKHVNYIIYTQGGKNKVDIDQWFGRGQRMNVFSNTLQVVDFYDRGGKYLESHVNERLAIYKELGFKIINKF